MKKVKSVAFNIADPYELALMVHSNRHKYFSTYVKRLIAKDMEENSKVNMKEFYRASEIIDWKDNEKN